MKSSKKLPDHFEPVEYIGKTARELNREEGGCFEPFFILPVPLGDERQCYYLRLLAEQGILGQNPHEVAAHLISEGIISRMGNKMPEDWRLYPPASWDGFAGENMADTLEGFRNRACTGKARHETFEGAIRQKNVRKIKPKNSMKGLKIGAYHCQFCDGYHVGHQIKGKKK